MTNTKCTILGCRYAEVSLSLERMREDFATVQNGAIELAQEYNSKIAALEARCRELLAEVARRSNIIGTAAALLDTCHAREARDVLREGFAEETKGDET